MHPECPPDRPRRRRAGRTVRSRPFRTLQLEDIIPDAEERRRQTFMYDVTELSTAVKPLLLQHLLAKGAPAGPLLRPGHRVLRSRRSSLALAERHHIVLTPHVLTPIPEDGFEVSDLAVLRAGVFNLGFIGVGAGTDAFLEWWTGRLRRHCLSDPDNGMFVDQRWLDYVAAVFPHAVVRDPALQCRLLESARATRRSDGDRIHGQRPPLRFYHFSGFNPDTPYLLSKHQGSNPRVAAQRTAGGAGALSTLRGPAPRAGTRRPSRERTASRRFRMARPSTS